MRETWRNTHWHADNKKRGRKIGSAKVSCVTTFGHSVLVATSNAPPPNSHRTLRKAFAERRAHLRVQCRLVTRGKTHVARFRCPFFYCLYRNMLYIYVVCVCRIVECDVYICTYVAGLVQLARLVYWFIGPHYCVVCVCMLATRCGSATAAAASAAGP